MSRAVLSIGSNLGDRLAHLRSVVAAFEPYLMACSRVFQTPPWGPVRQEDFLNAVLIVEDAAASARDWLERGWGCERAAERTRDVHWGPRTLDVDIVSVDSQHSDDPVLTLPHPRAAERAFVLVPWLDADPDAELPGLGPVADLLSKLDPAEVGEVRLRADLDLRP